MPDESANPRARALFIGSSDRRLFAWHHEPAVSRRRRAAIVLCPPLGYEYMSAYRSCRILAERLAARGFDVLRFDYEGTGNSGGGPEDPNRLNGWVRSVSEAVAEARRLAKTDAIAMVGVRAGSLLALQAASDCAAAERLALWSPFASGRAYVRELKAIARLNDEGADEDGPGINAEGHVVTEETVTALMQWSIVRMTRRPAPHLVLLERDDRHADVAIDTHLRALGSRVDRLSVPGTAEMLLPPHLAKIPEHALDTLVNWFDPWHPAVRLTASEDRSNVAEAAASIASSSGYTEHPVRFGPDERLFGIITRPAARHAAAPSVVFLSTGGGHHVGPHRLYVPIAREWAADGHVVLRFDLGGLGDSVPPHGTAGGNAYPSHRLDDAREAIARVREEAPGQQVILIGLCSGGWLAFEAARNGLPVDAIISINPPLYLREGREWVRQQRQLDRYQRSLRDPLKWLKALRGGTATTALRAIASRAGSKAAHRFKHLTGAGRFDDLDGDLRAIARRKIQAFFIFSDGDNGHRYFEQHARASLRSADLSDFIHQAVVADSGHVFRPIAAQRRLKILLNEFVARVPPASEHRTPQNATWTRRPV
jgi:alpha-beta hydrolase superfamily lysophospholipase